MNQTWSTTKKLKRYKGPFLVCLATSIDGRCALVSRDAIALTKLGDVCVLEKTIKRDSKWDTTCAEFSTLRTNLLALANANVVHIYDIDHNKQLYTLTGHTRSVADFNWSVKEENILATVSQDQFVHIYDLRDAKWPALSMHSSSGASQLKWSKRNDYTFATCHEGDVHIWDIRKARQTKAGGSPLFYVTAHVQKINTLDWSAHHPTRFVTCSHDGNIKIWDYSVHKSKPIDVLSTAPLPVWRARFTPFPRGLMTALVPQLRRPGENNSLWMWDEENMDKPLHTFAGHLDVIHDFGWWHTNESNKYGLVTWAKDNYLRQWHFTTDVIFDKPTTPVVVNGRGPFDDQLIYQEDAQEATDLLKRIEDSPSSDGLAELRKDMIESSDSLGEHSGGINMNLFTSGGGSSGGTGDKKDNLSLQQEFSRLNQNIRGLAFEELNLNKRMAVIAVRGEYCCRMKILFPNTYPHVIPHFMIVDEAAKPSSDAPGAQSSKPLTDMMKRELLKALQTTAAAQVQRNRACLEKCLRYFMATLDKFSANQSGEARRFTILDLLPAHKYGSYLDVSVPFPRTSGARFSSGQKLVCFGRPPHLEQMNVPTEFTPRSLSALSAYLTSHVRAFDKPSTIKGKEPSISLAYLDQSGLAGKKKSRRAQRRQQQQQQQQVIESPEHTNQTPPLCGPVSCFDATILLPSSRVLAEHYSITCKDVLELCQTNANIALAHKHSTFYATWHLVKCSAEIFVLNHLNNDCFTMTWHSHPFGRKMIHSMIDYFALALNDIQTAAMIAMTFIQLHQQLSDTNFSHRPNFPFFNEKAKLLPEIKSKRAKKMEETNSNEAITQTGASVESGEEEEVSDEEIEKDINKNEETNSASTNMERADSAPPITRGGHRTSESSMGAIQLQPSPSPPPLFPPSSLSTSNMAAMQQSHGAMTSSLGSPSLFQTQVKENEELDDSPNASKMSKNEKNEVFEAKSMTTYYWYCRTYCELLYRWRLMSQRAQLLKIMNAHMKETNNTSNDAESQASMVRLWSECRTPKCRQRSPPVLCATVVCKECKRVSLTCVICRLPVKGLTNHCLKCGHGGHSLHMQQWFANNDQCPRGCGCMCVTRRRKISDEEKPQLTSAVATGATSSASNSEHRGAKPSGKSN